MKSSLQPEPSLPNIPLLELKKLPVWYSWPVLSVEKRISLYKHRRCHEYTFVGALCSRLYHRDNMTCNTGQTCVSLTLIDQSSSSAWQCVPCWRLKWVGMFASVKAFKQSICIRVPQIYVSPTGASNCWIQTCSAEQTEGISHCLGNRKQNTDDSTDERSTHWRFHCPCILDCQ